MTKSTHGGPGRGQGRHAEPGYSKLISLRFLSEEEEAAVLEMSPRERVELILAIKDTQNEIHTIPIQTHR